MTLRQFAWIVITGTVSVAAYGSTQAGGANHALAWGIPTKSGFPYILDMAVAESSWGKIETMGFTVCQFRSVGLSTKPATKQRTQRRPKSYCRRRGLAGRHWALCVRR